MDGYPIKANARFALQGQPCKRRLGYRQEQVWKYINEVMASAGIAPSYGMIRDEFGIEKGNVSRIVADLERRGLLQRADVRWVLRSDGGRALRRILCGNETPVAHQSKITVTEKRENTAEWKATISASEAAEMLGVELRYLQYKRNLGQGPRFTRIGKYCRYTKDDVAEFAETIKGKWNREWRRRRCHGFGMPRLIITHWP